MVGVAYDGDKTRLGDILDLTNPDACAWMEAQIARVLETYECEFYRLDHNTGGLKRACALCVKATSRTVIGAITMRCMAFMTVYGHASPMSFAARAGGGGRTDLGLVRRFDHTWVTDWQIAPRSFAITNGMTMALPPEYVDRLVGGQFGNATASMTFSGAC